MNTAIGICLVLCVPIIASTQFAELRNGNKMPVLGLGTWRGDPDVLARTYNAALEAGYRHIDTASLYQNEADIGKVVKEWISAGKLDRKDLFVLTKLPSVGMHPELVSKFLKESLKKLQLDYVDMYLVHFPFGYNYKEDTLRPTTPEGLPDIDVNTNITAIWKAMEDQVNAGLTKSIGLSNFNASQISRILEKATILPSNLQIEIHADFPQNDMVEFCKKNGIVVTAYAPLGSPGSDSPDVPTLLENPIVNEIARKYNKTSGQVLLRHCTQKGLVCIPKSTNPERIQQNINIFDFKLTSQECEQLKGLDRGPSARIYKSEDFKGTHPEYPF